MDPLVTFEQASDNTENNMDELNCSFECIGDVLQKYQESIEWMERSVMELNKPTPNYWYLQLCTEKSALLIMNLCYDDSSEKRKEFLQEVLKTVCHVRKRIEESLGSMSAPGFTNEQESSLSCSYTLSQEGCSAAAPPNPDDESSMALSFASSSQPENSIPQDKQAQSRQRAIAATIVDDASITFDSVIGLDEAKKSLNEAIVIPLLYPHLFAGNRKPWTRILLYGPPGTGKSRLARAVASRIESPFYAVSSSDLLSSWFGESEKMVRDLFRLTRNCTGRSVIFMDEIDSLCRRRKDAEEEGSRRIKTELLRQMDGTPCSDNVFLLCATNCPWDIDSAFLRRFQKRIYIPLPDIQARISILKLHAGGDSDVSEADWRKLSELTDGYSGSDLANLVNTSLYEPIRELNLTTRWRRDDNGKFSPASCGDPCDVTCSFAELEPPLVVARNIGINDLKKCIATCKATVNVDDLNLFESFTRRFGQTGN